MTMFKYKKQKLVELCILSFTICGLLLGSSGIAEAQKGKTGKSPNEDDILYSCKKARAKIQVNMKNEVKVGDLIRWAQGFTCKNFIFNSRIIKRAQSVNIMTPKKMSPRQAWRLFLVALRSLQLTVVQVGNVLKIVEAASKVNEPWPIYRKGYTAADQIIRLLVRPEHLPLNEVSSILKELGSPQGSIREIPNASTLLITDFGSHITRMKTLLRALDQPVVPNERLYMIRVRYADVNDLSAKLQEILGSPDSSSRSSSRDRSRRNRSTKNSRYPSAAEVATAIPSKIVPDERTNSLIILGTKSAYVRVHALVSRLDADVDIEGGGQVFVYQLENADSKEMEETLNGLIQGISQGSSSSRSSSGRSNRRSSSNRRKSTSGRGAPAFEGTVRVTADEPTNTLVIVASYRDYLALQQVIKKLDSPRRQVYLEAVILEVQVTQSREIGASSHGGYDLDDGALMLGGVQVGSLSSLQPASLATANGLVGGALGPLLSSSEQLLGTSLPSFGVIFQAISTLDNVNVLSAPHILTTDNKTAKLSVGQNIPYKSALSSFGLPGGSSTGGTSGFGFPTQSIQRQDVVLSLEIKPHINSSDIIRLEIKQETSDIAADDFKGLGPSWSKRQFETEVVVKDQQTVVIGGLISEKETVSESKVPLLGDLPLIGYLFKFSKVGKVKNNLLLILTPYVIKDHLDIERILQKKMRERSEFVRSFLNFTEMKYKTAIDYRRKRGLLEDINRVVKDYEEIARELSKEEVEEGYPDGLIEYNSKGEFTKVEAVDGEKVKGSESSADKDGENKSDSQNTSKSEKKSR